MEADSSRVWEAGWRHLVFGHLKLFKRYQVFITGWCCANTFLHNYTWYNYGLWVHFIYSTSHYYWQLRSMKSITISLFVNVLKTVWWWMSESKNLKSYSLLLSLLWQFKSVNIWCCGLLTFLGLRDRSCFISASSDSQSEICCPLSFSASSSDSSRSLSVSISGGSSAKIK